MMNYLTDCLTNPTHLESALDNLEAQNMEVSTQLSKLDTKIQLIKTQGLNRDLLTEAASDTQNQIKQLQEQQHQVDKLIHFSKQYLQLHNKTALETHTAFSRLSADLKEDTATLNSESFNYMQRTLDDLQKDHQRKLQGLVAKKGHMIRISRKEIIDCEELMTAEVIGSYLKLVLGDIVQYSVTSEEYVFREATINAKQSQQTQEPEIIVNLDYVCFPRKKISHHFEPILHAISSNLELTEILQRLLPQNQLKQVFETEKKNLLLTFRSELEYLLPYFTLPQRKQLCRLISKEDVTAMTIHQLLILLKDRNQDADSLSNVINAVGERLLGDPHGNTEAILTFMEMALRHKQYYNMVYFACDTMIGLLDESQVDYKLISSMLSLRQSARYKIHNVE